VNMLLPLLSLLFTATLGIVDCVHYDPTWDSLDSRPLPQWYDDAKVGIFIHWGVYAVPSFGLSMKEHPSPASEWFWNSWNENKTEFADFMEKNYPPGFTYQDFAAQFTTEFFNSSQWAETFQASGAQYVVLSSKHHDGYTLWPSKYSWNWNSMDVGPKRDLVGELAESIRANTSLTFGLYHSLFEWFNPVFLEDQDNKFETQDFVMKKLHPELEHIVNTYRPEVIYSDGDWAPPNSTYWQSTKFLSWLFNDSPVKDTVVVNDRWGHDSRCEHGSYVTCHDRYNPGTLQPKKWENALTFDKFSWGYRRNANMSDYLSIEEVLQELITTISCGGNMLINIGPTKEGTLPAIMEERMLRMGVWLGINGEGIYSTTPWKYQNDTLTTGVWYTQREDAVYATVLNWPEDNQLTLGSVKATEKTVITMLGQDSQHLTYSSSPSGLNVTFPRMSQVNSEWAWMLKLMAVNPSPKPASTS
ncbi:unnamed protein product, partial [Meganyctiphanes norvegica]